MTLSVACECCGSAIGNDGNNRYRCECVEVGYFRAPTSSGDWLAMTEGVRGSAKAPTGTSEPGACEVTVPVEQLPPTVIYDHVTQINSAEEANAAHRRIVGSVQDAIAIGEYLTMKKQSLPHGQWLPWLKENIDFDQATAWRYSNLYANQGKLCSVHNLNDAYKLLSAKAPEDKPEPKPKAESKAKPATAKTPKKEPPSAYKPEEMEAEVVVGPDPDPQTETDREEKDCMDPDELRRKSVSAPPMAIAQAWEIVDIISGWRESDVTFHKALDAVEEKVQLMRVGNNYPDIRR
jgi:Protein of unknown function (DUF3102)